MDEVESTLRRWNIEEYTVLKENIQGSPRRVIDRYLIKSDRKYILERIDPRKRMKKMKEAELMELLKSHNLPVLRYMKNSEDSYFSVINGHLWMLREYADGVDLKRPEYIHDRMKGSLAAQFLIDMRKIEIDMDFDIFSLKHFIEGQRRVISRRYPKIDEKLKDIYLVLKEFMGNYDKLPLSFNHGDFHPLNIIWGKERIVAVIDWEFMGLKPELYDAANMVGCVGIENPDALEGEMVREFISILKNKGGFSEVSWRFFPELVLALRFAWLREWISQKDDEMIEMEIYYMQKILKDLKFYKIQ